MRTNSRFSVEKEKIYYSIDFLESVFENTCLTILQVHSFREI